MKWLSFSNIPLSPVCHGLKMASKNKMRGFSKNKIAWSFLFLHTGSFVLNPALTSTGSNMREGGKEGSSWTRLSMSPLLVNFIHVSHWHFDLFHSFVCAHLLSLCVSEGTAPRTLRAVYWHLACVWADRQHMHIHNKQMNYWKLMKCT